jgi:hypothetical protein
MAAQSATTHSKNTAKTISLITATITHHRDILLAITNFTPRPLHALHDV